MRSVRKLSILLIALLFSFIATAQAEVEKGATKTLKLEAKPIDMAVSADGKYTYILAEGGKILIFDTSGQIKDTLTVSESVVSIGTSPKGDFLLLADSKENTLEVVKISFVVDIDGPENAPVVIAVFNDYQ
jgi:DNA-binding beta-propeller fold protein YncE